MQAGDAISNNELDHVLRNPIDLLLWLHVRNRVEVKAAITLEETRTNSFEFLSVFRRRTVVLGPNEMDHFLNSGLGGKN